MAFAPPGQAPLTPGVAQNLKAALSGQAAPSNPKTPDDRTNPRETSLLNLQRIRRAFERALEPFEAGIADEGADVLRAMHGVISRMLAGVSPTEAVKIALQSLIPPVPSPMLAGATPGMAAPQATAGPMPSPPLGGPPPGLVSPGNLPPG